MFSIYNRIIEKQRPLVMGILNVTPDSFFEAGKSFFAESAFNRALQIESDGADIIDIGGCSTSPGKSFASFEEELSRLKTVLPLIPDTVNIPVSVDTFRPEIAKFALENGTLLLGRIAVLDTMQDLIVDSIGAFVMSIIGYISLKYKKGWVEKLLIKIKK
jgi:dihydropteroate synthase